MINIIKNFFISKLKINIKKLPSLGLFYKEDFEIYINRASKDDVISYEDNFNKEDIGQVIYQIKEIVKNNIKLSINYTYDDIKSIDIIFIFLEIVKFTKGTPICLNYFTNDNSKVQIEFGEKYFNYFEVSDDLMKYYDKKDRSFLINGYKFTLPTIGIEDSLTKFLMIKSTMPNTNHYVGYKYDFTYFVGHKNLLYFDEVENLVQIFNFDMDVDELKKVKKIVEIFSPIQRYSLKKDGKVVEMSSRINLERIWKI
jgi:hypothetical protein